MTDPPFRIVNWRLAHQTSALMVDIIAKNRRVTSSGRSLLRLLSTMAGHVLEATLAKARAIGMRFVAQGVRPGIQTEPPCEQARLSDSSERDWLWRWALGSGAGSGGMLVALGFERHRPGTARGDFLDCMR